MKLSEASTQSEIGRFCTCSERPESVEDIVTTAVDASSQTASRHSTYCTCQVDRPTYSDLADPETLADDFLTDADDEPQDVAEPITDEDSSQRRPYCTCPADWPAHADPAATETSADDLPTDTDVEAEDVAEATPDRPESPVSTDQVETDLARLETTNGEIMLTDRRVIMHGNSDSPTLWASMSIDEVTGARIDRTQRGIRGWIWTAVGVAATIAIWQILDGGGWIRLVFPGLVGLSTIIMLFTTLVSPLHLIFSVVGRNGDKIDARISSDELDNAETFGGKVIQASRDSAARSSDS